MSEHHQPRQEAGVIAAEVLTGDQRQALRRIIEYLNRIAATSTEPPHKDVWARIVPRVDKERSNHVFLIDGNRGSGKSAVLLTLLHVLSETLRKGRPPSSYELPIAEHAIVPVGLIDLQPMHESTHLLLHLVGQLGRLAEVLDEVLAPGKASVAANLWAETGERESARARREFNRVATAALHGGLGMRARELSLEEHAIELEHAERRRLDLDHTFRKFVDALAKDYRDWSRTSDTGPGPLFVIAVDDADMNPGRSRELLDLVRTLWHPRVAYVLTGDRELFLDTIERDLMIEVQLDRPRRPWSELARNIYDKIIPGPQHLHLPRLSWRDRIHALRQALNARLPDTSARPESIEALLDLFAEDNQSTEAIPDRLRDIQDLALILNGATGSVAELVHGLLRQAEMSHPLPYQFQLEDDGTGRKWLFIHAQLQDWRLEWHRYIEIPAKSGVGIEARIEVLTSARLRITGTGGRPTEDSEYLRRAAGILLFAMDAERYDIRVHTGAVLDVCWVLAQFEGVSVPWPLPAWPHIATVARMTQRWLEESRKPVPAKVDRVTWLAAVYLWCVLHTAEDERSLIARNDPSMDLLDEQGNIRWQEIAVQVAWLALTTTQPALYSWARAQAALLAAPESGLPYRDANRWIDAFYNAISPSIQWDAIASRIKEARRSRMHRTDAGPSGSPAEHVFQHLDRQYSSHAFARKVHEHSDITEPLQTALNKLDYPILPGVTPNQTPQYFDIFLQGERARNLAMVPIERQTAMAQALRTSDLRGLTQKSLYDLWKMMAEHYRESIDPNFIRLDGDRIVMELDVQHEPKGDSLSLHLGDGIVIDLFHASYPAIRNLPIAPQDDLDAVIRLIYDFMIDTRDREGSRSENRTTDWKYLRIRDHHLDNRYLPAPDWPGLLDWEILYEAWNESLDALARMDIQGNTALARKAYESIVHWYVQKVRGTFRTRRISRLDYAKADPSYWEHLGDTINREVTPIKERAEVDATVLREDAKELKRDADEAAVLRRQADALEADPVSTIPSRRGRAFSAWLIEIKRILLDEGLEYHLSSTAYQALQAGELKLAEEKVTNRFRDER